MTSRGVIIPAKDPKRSTAYTRTQGWKGDPDPDPTAEVKPGWYDVLFLRFTDDLQHWQTETASIHLANAGPQSLDVKNPGLSKGKMVQFSNGDIVAPMYGGWLEHETELDVWKAGPSLVGEPKLAFRSIREADDHPTVRTDDQGRFRFDDVKLGECVLTVEAEGYAPQQRHIKVRPQTQAEDFTLTDGRLVRGRVADTEGQPVGGVCVVLNHWHCHTDPRGYFHWSVESPVPERVTLRVYKRYSGHYEILTTTVALSQLERRPIILKNQ